MSVTARAIRETGGPTVLVVGAVADGQALVRSGSTIIGGTAGGGAPTGAAGGDLGGTYPNPTVLSIANVTTGTLPVARGGTGLPALGTKYQVLQTDSTASAMEWVDPSTQAPIITLPNTSASLGSTYASHVGVPAFGAITTSRISVAGNVDRIIAEPWVAPYTKSVSTVMWELTTGDAGKVVNFALYESDVDGYPTNRIAAVSSVSLTTPALKTSAFASSVTVQRGRLYWLAWTTDSATTAIARSWPMPSYSGLGFFTGVADLAFAASSNYFRVTATYAVPPATMPTGGTFPGFQVPVLGLY